MSDKLKLIFLLAIILIPVIQAFELYPNTGIEELCPSTTGVFVDVIKDPSDYVTITTGGTASSFSTSFIYKNEIYTYVTPKSTTPSGDYTLTIVAKSDQETSSLEHEFSVKECQDYEILAKESSASLCPCESTEIEFEITNNGELDDTYSLSVEGKGSEYIILSENKVSVESGSTETITAFVQDTCNLLEDYEFTVVATPSIGRLTKSATSEFQVTACYDFELKTEEDFKTVCESTEDYFSITINNKGTVSNKYILDITGPSWASLENNNLEVSSNSQASTKIFLNPSYNSEGDYEIELEVLTDKGNLKATNTFATTIKACMDVLVDIKEVSDKICADSRNEYEVDIKNNGDLEQEYILEIDGPSWISLSDGRITLSSGGEETLILTASPTEAVNSLIETIGITATSTETSEVSSKDTIEIETISTEDCYKPSIAIQDEVSIYFDSTGMIPVTIENQGAESAKYDISTSGTATEFIQLVPLSTGLTVEPETSEILYLYLTPTTNLNIGEYELTVTAKLNDSAILATDTINIEVTSNPSDIIEDTTELEEEFPEITGGDVLDIPQGEGISFFTRIKNFFASLFGWDEEEQVEDIEEILNDTTEEEILDDLEDIIEEDDLNITNEDTEEEEEPTETDGDTIFELSEESQTADSSLEEGEIQSFKFNEETHTIELVSSEENTITLEFNSEPVILILEIGESRTIDINGDGGTDLEVTLNDFVDGKADITYNYLLPPDESDLEEETEEETPTEDITEEETAEELTYEEPSAFLNKVAENKTPIIIVLIIIIVLLILIKTKTYKKIIDFFEEEIEEEALETETTKQETKPEEKPKEEVKEPETQKEEKPKEEKKKEEKKGDDDDDDEFEIIH